MMKTMVGTILYNSPEIVQSQPYSNKTDVWAIGCLLYKMATLSDPFQGTNPLAVARKIVECEYDRLDPSIHSAMLVTACERCLTVCPKTRPDTQDKGEGSVPADHARGGALPGGDLPRGPWRASSNPAAGLGDRHPARARRCGPSACGRAGIPRGESPRGGRRDRGQSWALQRRPSPSAGGVRQGGWLAQRRPG
ncbi:unnamed protein product, partial [Prorocentrum cordatum]